MATDKALKPVKELGWKAGFRNMLKKENARWWSLKSMAVNLFVWLFLINAMVVVTILLLSSVSADVTMQDSVNATDNNTASYQAVNSGDGDPEIVVTEGSLHMSPQDIANAGMSVFFQLAGIAIFIGAVIIGHDSILKERETGTAAWLLSKPVSRKSFVLSKILASSFGIMVLVVLAQGIIAYAICSVKFGAPMPVLPFLAGLCILGLGVLFYLVLSIGLGAFSSSRGIVLGVPIVVGLVGGFILAIRPELHYFMPWDLTGYATTLATGGTLPSDFYWPIIATVIWIAIFVMATVMRFERIEL